MTFCIYIFLCIPRARLNFFFFCFSFIDFDKFCRSAKSNVTWNQIGLYSWFVNQYVRVFVHAATDSL